MGVQGKLYNTQYNFLSNVKQLPFFLETYIHTYKGEGDEF